MAANKLRILYANKLSAAVGGASPSNLLNDYKSQTSSANSFTLTTSAISGPIAVIAMLAEDTVSVTMTVAGNVNTESTVSQVTSTAPVGYGGGKYIAVYFNQAVPATSFTVSFSKVVKVARFIVGNYWEPTYSAPFGMQVTYEDTTTNDRLQSGDLYSNLGPRHKALSFELEYLNDADKFKLFDIMKLIGKSKPIFVSLFPESTDEDREQMYSIYGKFQSIPTISYAMYTKYTSSVQLEEI